MNIKLELLKDSLLNGNIFITKNSYGSSMWPLISFEDKIYIKYKAFNKLKKGDIILFIQDNKAILHRIISIKNQIIVTKGDNNTHNDKFNITENNYLGVLILIKKKRVPIKIGKKSLFLIKYTIPVHKYIRILIK